MCFMMISNLICVYFFFREKVYFVNSYSNIKIWYNKYVIIVKLIFVEDNNFLYNFI